MTRTTKYRHGNNFDRNVAAFKSPKEITSVEKLGFEVKNNVGVDIRSTGDLDTDGLKISGYEVALICSSS